MRPNSPIALASIDFLLPRCSDRISSDPLMVPIFNEPATRRIPVLCNQLGVDTLPGQAIQRAVVAGSGHNAADFYANVLHAM